MTTGVLKKCHETEFEVEVSWEIKKFLSPTSQSPKISPAFTWSSVDWELQMTCYSLKKIRLFLYTSVQRTSILSYLPSSIYEKHIPAIFKFGIRKSDGTTETRCILTKNFSYSENSFGTSEFILGAELEERKHQLLPEGILTLSCSIASLDTLNKPLNETYESKCGS